MDPLSRITQSGLLWLTLLSGALLSSCPVAAHETEETEELRDWHVGVNLRTDFGTHPGRIDGGVRVDPWDFVLVMDPMYFLDEQHDLDALAHYEFARGWSVFLGWRGTSIGILDGTQWQQKSLHGIAGRLPEVLGRRLRAQWGFELAVLWVKHGGELPTEPLSLATSRDWLDHFNFGMFVRFEYNSPF